jgi:pimeloyl-ACP methyl ester carboxylesterase
MATGIQLSYWLSGCGCRVPSGAITAPPDAGEFLNQGTSLPGMADLHYVQRGEGEPLLLIQGMSGTHLSWGETFLAELERDFALTVFDNRGVGRNTFDPGPFSIADLADDAAGLLDTLGLDSAHVLGISMGGMVAQELTLRHPARVRTLALGCTYAGGAGSALTDPSVFQRLSQAWMTGDRDQILRTAWEINVSGGFARDETAYEAFKAAALSLPVPQKVIMAQLQAVSGHDTSARLGEIEAPTLVIHGDEDQMLPVSNAKAIAAAIPNARLEILEGVGHMFWIEEPARSAALLRDHALARATS